MASRPQTALTQQQDFSSLGCHDVREVFFTQITISPKKNNRFKLKPLFNFCIHKLAFSLKHQPSKTRQWNNVQTWPEKRGVCITTRASVLAMATHPEPLPFIVGAAGTRLYGCSLEYDSAGTDCWGEGKKKTKKKKHTHTIPSFLPFFLLICLPLAA